MHRFTFCIGRVVTDLPEGKVAYAHEREVQKIRQVKPLSVSPIVLGLKEWEGKERKGTGGIWFLLFGFIFEEGKGLVVLLSYVFAQKWVETEGKETKLI